MGAPSRDNWNELTRQDRRLAVSSAARKGPTVYRATFREDGTGEQWERRLVMPDGCRVLEDSWRTARPPIPQTGPGRVS